MNVLSRMKMSRLCRITRVLSNDLLVQTADEPNIVTFIQWDRLSEKQKQRKESETKSCKCESLNAHLIQLNTFTVCNETATTLPICIQARKIAHTLIYLGTCIHKQTVSSRRSSTCKFHKNKQ